MQNFSIPDNGSIIIEADPVDSGGQPGNITTAVEWSASPPDLLTVNVDTGSPPHRRCQFVAKGQVGSVTVTCTAQNDETPPKTISDAFTIQTTPTPASGFQFKAVG
jgi:hypothetical protein